MRYNQLWLELTSIHYICLSDKDDIFKCLVLSDMEEIPKYIHFPIMYDEEKHQIFKCESLETTNVLYIALNDSKSLGYENTCQLIFIFDRSTKCFSSKINHDSQKKSKA